MFVNMLCFYLHFFIAHFLRLTLNPFKSVHYSLEVSSAHQACIYLIKNSNIMKYYYYLK